MVTHVDCAGSDANLNVQTEYVRTLVQHKLRTMHDSVAQSNALPLRCLCDGESFRVDCLRGHGVRELRRSIIELTLSLPWYAERIPTSYIELQTFVTRGMKEGRTWMDWSMYAQGALVSGLDDMHLRIATVFLHEIGTLKYFFTCLRMLDVAPSHVALTPPTVTSGNRYFGNVPAVLQKVAQWHPPLRWLDTLEDTVRERCRIARAFVAHIRPDHDAVLCSSLCTSELPRNSAASQTCQWMPVAQPTVT